MSSSLDDLLQDAAALSLIAPAVSFASPVAAGSPVARMEGVSQGGGDEEGMGTGKRGYPVVLIDESDRSLCFGFVGRGVGSFCIRKDCTTQSHTLRKVVGRTDGSSFFIARLGNTTIFSEPSVREAQVPKETQDEWEGKMWSLPQWVRAFRAVDIADDVTASNDDIKMETKLLADAEMFRTPSKKRKSEIGESFTKPLSTISVVAYQRSLPEEGEDEELEALITGGTLGRVALTKIVSRLESSVIEMGKGMEEIAVLAQGRFVQNETNVELVSGAVQNLMSAFGPSVEMDSRFDAPTLWGTVSFIGEEVTRMIDDVETSKEGLTTLRDATWKALKELREEAMSSSGGNPKMLKVLALVMNRVQELGPEIDKVRNHIGRLEAEVEKSTKSKKQKLGPAANSSGGVEDVLMDDLMTMLSPGSDTGSPTPTKEGNGDPGNRVGRDEWRSDPAFMRVESELNRVTQETRLLVMDVGLLKASAEDKSIRFAGLGLRSLQECHAWIQENFQGFRYGLVMDPLLMLDRIFGSDDVEAESQFKVLESRVKLKITTGAEAAAIKALHFNRPRLFHKGRVPMTSERNTSKLSKLPNYKSWKSGGEGVRNYVTKQMNLIHTTVTHDIGYAFGTDVRLAQAQAVATSSLNATITFLTQLMGFIDTIYEKLHTHSRFSTEQAWSLTTQILDRVCEDLYAPKEGVAAAMTVEDPSSICSHLLWSCFRTHDVMSTYIDYNFENHPAISAEYVKFLATNSGYDKVEKMEAAVIAMKDNVAKALDAADKAAKRADVATDKFSAANKEVEALKKRVQGLENKVNK